MQKDSNYHRILFEKAVIGLALCKINGDFVDVNEACAQLIGRTIKQTLRLNCWSITTEKYKDKECEVLSELEKYGKYGPFEKEYIHKDGHVVPVKMFGQLMEMDGERYIWSSIENITEAKKTERRFERLRKKLELLSFKDGLTNIANRRMFDATLEKEWQRAQRKKIPLSLIMADIDFFKQYNDFYGHQQGDECLKVVANLLKRVSRRSMDLASRYGGEEFVLLLPETDYDKAVLLAEKCLDVVRDEKIPHEKSRVADTVTVSAGVCTLIPEIDAPSSLLMEGADEMLYKAKKAGRNRFFAK